MRSDNSTHIFRHITVPAAALAVGAFLVISPLRAAPPADEAGVWINHTGKGAIEILPCGNRLCGRIVWLKEPNKKNGQPLTDGHNPNIAHRKRPICGLPVLGDLKPQPNGSWDTGWVYNPEDGQTHDAAVELASADRLTLTGYKGIKLFSKSFTWTRAPANLPRCDTTTAAVTPPPAPAAAAAPPAPIKKLPAKAAAAPSKAPASEQPTKKTSSGAQAARVAPAFGGGEPVRIAPSRTATQPPP